MSNDMSNDELTQLDSAKPAADLGEWFAEQYLASVGNINLEGGHRYKKMMASFPVQNSAGEYVLSSRYRAMAKFLAMKTRFPINQDGYTCMAMTATVGEYTTIYAYAYWRTGQENNDPEYICASPTYESQDGEFRNGFTDAKAFLDICEKNADVTERYESAILNMTKKSVLALESTVFPDTATDLVSKSADSLRLPILAFVSSLMIGVRNLRQSSAELHVSKQYTGVLQIIIKDQPQLLDETNVDNENKLIFIMETTADSDELNVVCGQKLVPMHTRETMQTFDYNLAVWRELAITRLVSDFVINFISPGFAMYNQWSYIDGIDETLFENGTMRERFTRAQVAGSGTELLRDARRALTDASGYRIEELSAHVYESIEYAQSFLLMAPVAMLHVMEHVGVPMMSLPLIARNNMNTPLSVVKAFETSDAAAHTLFDLVYAAHCLHTKLGVAHTDLHGNNMTLHAWEFYGNVTANDIKIDSTYYDDPIVAYVTGPRGEADTYIFPATGSNACIIDYSRSIVGPAFRDRLTEGKSSQYATNFYRDQVNRVMRALHRYAPKIVENNQDVLKSATLANFDAVFPVLCAVDFIAIGSSVGAMIAKEAANPSSRSAAKLADDSRAFTIAPEAAGMAQRLEDIGRELFILGLHDLVETRGGASPASFPGNAVIARMFSEWCFPRWASREAARVNTAQLVDVYNYNNELRWNSANYKKWPPWARFDVIERHLGEYKMTDLFVLGVEPFLDALRTGARVEVIAERVRAAQEKLDGGPVSTASSWIDE